VQEVKAAAQRIAPLRFGGTTRERPVVVAVGGAACAGKSWLARQLAADPAQGGAGALVLSMERFRRAERRGFAGLFAGALGGTAERGHDSP
jgi:adenylylsulfate kinase-like enzyme